MNRWIATAVAAVSCAFFACATTGSAAAPTGQRSEKHITGESQTSTTGIRLAQGPLSLSRVEWTPTANIGSAELRVYTSTDPNCPIDAGAVWAKLRQGEPYTGQKAIAANEFLCAYQNTKDQNGDVAWWDTTAQAQTPPTTPAQ